MEPMTGKRIVSKGEYAMLRGRRTVEKASGRLLQCLAALCALCAICGCIGLLAYLVPALIDRVPHAQIVLLACLLDIVVAGIGTFILYLSGYVLVYDAKHIDVGVPLTRANTADLPALDSLVRASEEPMQMQHAVLLRAASEGQETPPEQLVRAVNGQE